MVGRLKERDLVAQYCCSLHATYPEDSAYGWWDRRPRWYPSRSSQWKVEPRASSVSSKSRCAKSLLTAQKKGVLRLECHASTGYLEPFRYLYTVNRLIVSWVFRVNDFPIIVRGGVPFMFDRRNACIQLYSWPILDTLQKISSYCSWWT